MRDSFLRFVDNQTEDLCLLAVKDNKDALKYVKDQTIKVCLEATSKFPEAYIYVKDDDLRKELKTQYLQSY